MRDQPEHDIDQFAAALQALSSARAASPSPETPPAGTTPAPDPTPPRSPRWGSVLSRRIAAGTATAGVLAVVGLLTVGMTTTPEALPHDHADPAAATITASQLAAEGEIQAFVVPADTRSADVTRDGGYSVGTLVELASTANISNPSNSVFSNNRECAVQWPYAAGVPTGSGFGMRNGRMHEGVDFDPGDGAQIQAIADGVVRISTDNGGAFGVTIVVDHVVDGQTVSSRYAHMQYDSRQVQVGDTVSVGQYIGRTGNTGRSFGAHLHFEILQRGTTAIDPMPWLRTYATC